MNNQQARCAPQARRRTKETYRKDVMCLLSFFHRNFLLRKKKIRYTSQNIISEKFIPKFFVSSFLRLKLEKKYMYIESWKQSCIKLGQTLSFFFFNEISRKFCGKHLNWQSVCECTLSTPWFRFLCLLDVTLSKLFKRKKRFSFFWGFFQFKFFARRFLVGGSNSFKIKIYF